MFRIESYVTSIILSYVDRYIKNFRLQDAQVSLWEGDGVFHNLDLDLEVLEQELNLPFSFVSGHINELLIHVPWTRINSEPVRITINTIECVIKLRSPGSRQTIPAERIRRHHVHKTEENVAPPTYMSNLVNKIICNLSVTCNNFILKYVEEDIVFSMNIKTLNLESVNSKWDPEFSELTPSKLVLRKLVSLSDITICLDKRNASGRIESYLEPLLYRCFLTVRLTRTYLSVNASKASSTRLDVFCEKMAFTLSEPQVPMLMRMCALALALQKKQLTPKSSASIVSDNPQDPGVEEIFAADFGGENVSWSTWVWSWVPVVPFLVNEDGASPTPVASHTLQFGFYIEKFSLTLKLCNMVVDLQGCLMELESHDTDWTNVQMGISHMNIVPSGDCCCGTSEVNQLPYMICGSQQNTFLSGSLFGNIAARRVQERSWDYHIATVTEALLLEKTPALAVDYLFVVEPPQSSEVEEDEEPVGPPIERVLIRHVADGVVVRICSGLIHRTQMLLKSASTYDYVPYSTQYPLPEKSVESIHEPAENVYIPQYMSRYTLFHPKFEIYPANHSPVQPSSLGRKLSRSQKRAQQAGSSVLPSACVVLEWSLLDAKLTRPLNPDKVQLLSVSHNTSFPELVSETETRFSLKVVNVCSTMCLPSVQPMKILELTSVSLDWTSQLLIKLPPSKIMMKIEGNFEHLMLTLSKPKLLLLFEIINSLVMSNNKQRYQASYETLYHTSLIQDAAATLDLVYLKMNVNKASAVWVQTSISESMQMGIDACQAFVIQLADKGHSQQTMILVAPQTPSNKPFMTALFQRPVGEQLNTLESQPQIQHGPVFLFCLHGVRISIDPMLYTWLLYTPLPIMAPTSRPFQTQMSHVSASLTVGSSKSRRLSESSSSAQKRAPTPQESVHSSSERETTPSLQLSSQQPISEVVKEPANPTFVERVTALYPVWQSIVIFGEVSELSVYFPNSTLCSHLPQPMESSLQAGLKKSSPQLQMAVVKLPLLTLLCSSLKQAPFEMPLPILPVVLPNNIWTPDKCNFPWSLKINDLHCFTLHGSTQLKLLKPFSATCTVGVSTKYSGSLLTSLALCVHLDTTAISISVCEEQVSLMANLAVIQAQVLQTLLPVWSGESHAAEDILLSTEVPVGSEDSLSTSQPGDENSEGSVAVAVKLTGWMQWTLARFTLNIYNPSSRNSPESLKLSLDVEDIFFSLDIERVYHKLKLKVSTASIQHYCRSSIKHPWLLGPFQGLVMRGHDPDGIGGSTSGMSNNEDPAANSSGFLTATLTRACCSNLHSKLGTPAKTSKLLQKNGTEDKFVTEIAVKLQPLDIVLSPNTIGTILNVLNPLLKMPETRAPPRPVIQQQQPTTLTSINSSSLPLLYLDLMAVRIVLPAANSHCQHDVILIQFDSVNASPQPENPVCRVPVRLDIYQAAEKHRILGVPGSEVEDRQYQVDIVALTIKTGIWNELKTMLIKDVVPSLQNPALDWNEGRRPSSNPPALENMLPVIPSFNLCIVFAPAIIYREKTVVCGHSIEVNAVSEIMITLSTEQIELFGVLANEITHVLPEKSEAEDSGDVGLSLWAPQLPLPPVPLNFDSIDSGLESYSGSTQAQTGKAGSSDVHTVSVHSVGFNKAKSMSPAPSVQPTSTSFSSFSKRVSTKERYVPLEVLITGNAISCSLCKPVNTVKFIEVIPLLYLRISQPHVFLSKLGETKTCQTSVYDFTVRCGKSDSTDFIVVAQNQIKSQDFVQSLFETRCGDPHPATGILPALLTLKCSQIASKPVKLEVDLGRPIRITFRVDILAFLNQVSSDIINRWKVTENFGEPSNLKICKEGEVLKDLEQNFSKESHQSHWSSQLKKSFNYFSHISLSSQKILLAVLTKGKDTGNVGVSVDKITLQSVIAQHTVTNQISFEAVVVSTQLANQNKLLVNPWSLSVKAVLLWESWSALPILHISANSEVLSIDISPKHVQCLKQVFSEYCAYFEVNSCPSDSLSNQNAVVNSSRNATSVTAESDQQEQHYREDLQAGAFQFIDGNNDQEDLPLIYQVVFSTGIHHNPTMAWRYPQPRALTRLHIQPLPFRDSQPGDTVDCILQYWSDTHGTYKDYINFSLCESAACTVALPTSATMPVVASTWRVVLGIRSIQQPLPVNVKALAACLRVDSYFCPSLIPSIKTAVTLSCCTITLWTEANGARPMPNEFKQYRPDGCLPLSHSVLTFSLNQSDITHTSWAQGTQLISLIGTSRLDVLNYRTLNMHCCVEPFKLVSNLSIQPDSAKSLNLVSEAVTCRIGPSVCHTIATASQLWTQYSTNVPRHFIIVTPYIICNNSCLPIRFGQSSTDEVISIECLQCHLYSWYSTRHPLSLRFSLALLGGKSHWSKPVQLSKEGSFSVIVCDEESRDWSLVVTIKSVTNFIYEVNVAGQLIIKNNLDSSIELLISSERQNSLVVPAQTAPPGVILSPHFLPSLRIRFPGISFTWSGLVSLKGDGASQTKQWLVKIPLQEKGEFRCLWCHVVWDHNSESGRILVVLSSMYRIMSQLPCGATVQLQTPDLNVSQTVSVEGRGIIQDLNCLGTPDVSHKLTFRLDGRVLSSSPEVPLSYSMMEGQQSSKATPSVNMNKLIDQLLNKPKVTPWPIASSDWKSCSWASAAQPDTVIHVKVLHGQEWIEPSSLQVDLQPWALLLNSLGCHISLQSSGRFICSLPHMSVLAPPTLESTFHLGLYIGTSVNLSSSLQLSCDKAFFMPHIAGLIPLKGHINTSVECGSVISFVNIVSSEENSLRLIHVRSSFVIANFSSKVLKVAPVVVGREVNQVKENILPPNIDYHTFTLRSQKPTDPNCKALPITEWFNIAKSEETLVLYLAVSAGGDFSCPILVSQSTERQSVPVLVPYNQPESLGQQVNFMLLLCSEQRDGQTFLSLWEQPYPPLVIHNLTRTSIVVAKAFSEKGGEAVPYSPDWGWQLKLDSGCSADYQLPIELESRPDKIPSNNDVPIAVIAVNYRSSPSVGYKWSEGISLSPCRGRLIGLPGTSGVNVAVTKRGFTTHVTLSHSSHSEISPLDVRSRLSREAQHVTLNDGSTSTFEAYAVHNDKSSKNQEYVLDVEKPFCISSNVQNIASEKKPGLEDVTCFMQGITVVFSVEGEFACDCREIAAFVMDDVALTVQPTTHPDFDVKELLIRLTLGDLQLDNQEYARGGYDFPVVLMTQQINEPVEPQPIQFSVNGSALTLVEMSRIKGSALDLVFTLDVTSHDLPDLQDASLTLMPLQVYIEDTYIMELKDHLQKAIPAYTLTDNEKLNQAKCIPRASSTSPTNSSPPVVSCPLKHDDVNINVVDDDQKGILFFNMKPNISDEILDDKDEDLFNVSEPDNENIHGFGFIPENIHETVPKKDNKIEKDVLFESDVPWVQTDIYTSKEEVEDSLEYMNEIPIPREIVSSAQELACPLRLRSLLISPLVIHVSLHTSTTFYIGLDHSPLNFSAFQRGNLVTTAYRLGHALTLHYFLGAVYGSAWALVSLEMLGSPGGLARTVGTGLWDFVSLPYQGIQQGPRAFLTGIAHGSASLMRHVTAGTLTSVTKLASSWARTLDRLTLNQDDLRLTEEARRLRPQGLTQGLMHGLTEFGISLLGAMGSLVHGPLQYAVSSNPDQSFVNSVGLGVMGVFTRPLSGAAEFLALTGEGLLSGAGWSNLPKPRSQPRAQHTYCGTESLLKYSWKILQNSEHLLLALEASGCNNYEPVVLLLTRSNLYVIQLDKLNLIKSISLTDLRVSAHHSDPTLLTLRVLPLEAEAEALSRTRLAQFVRDSQRVITGDQDVMSQASLVDINNETEPPISFYVNPELRGYFIAFATFARRYVIGRDFPLVS